MAEITKKEFLELLGEFSEKNLEPKFSKMDSEFVEFKEDIIHRFHIISEDVISKVKLVAEGVASLNEKLDRHIDDDKREHKDILAAIKFSYAELDRRITTLEAEMEDLKRRMDKIEHRSIS
jgi:uncharacterized small protein (DUF1192 family)